MAERKSTASKSSGASPQRRSTASKSSGASTQRRSTASKSSGASTQRRSTASKSSGASTQRRSTASKSSGSTKPRSTASKSSGSAQPRSTAGKSSESTEQHSSPSQNGSSRKRLSGREAIERVRSDLPELLGRPIEGVLGLESDNGGWTVTVQVVELARIPRSTDVLGSYEVTLDGGGELIGCRRTRRFNRGQADED